MRYKIEVIEKESGKIEATVGHNLNDYYAEKIWNETQRLVDLDRYEVKVSRAF